MESDAFSSASSVDLKELRRKCYETYNAVHFIPTPISYELFFTDYMLPNKLCLFGKWATDGWRSRQEWCTASGKIAFDFLKQEFGPASAPIANCGLSEYDSHPKIDMTFEEFINYMTAYISKDYPNNEPCYYLKDWHFTRCYPLYKAYTCPVFFSSDWLNEFWDFRSDEKDDYRFVYIGPKGSWTPFHTDVYKSHSWSANIVGRKKWIFLVPGEEDKLRDQFGQLPFDLRDVCLDHCKHFELIQRGGEVVFVPSGWHHQVFNEEDTISINHNWMNGCNVDLCWEHIQQRLADVEKELSDIQHITDWHQECQKLLKATSGIDFKEFFSLLKCIINHRSKDLTMSQPSESDFSPRKNKDHVHFDILQAQHTLKSMLSNEQFQMLDFDDCDVQPQELLLKANELVDSL